MNLPHLEIKIINKLSFLPDSRKFHMVTWNKVVLAMETLAENQRVLPEEILYVCWAVLQCVHPAVLLLPDQTLTKKNATKGMSFNRLS